MIIFLNGCFLSQAEAKLSVDDRGFLFGDGVYEVIRVRAGAMFESEAHFTRLQTGVDALRLPTPAGGATALEEVCLQLLERNDLLSGDATVYVQVTRGAAPRDHRFPTLGTPPTVYVAAKRFSPSRAMQEEGVRAITRPDIRWARCDLKTINLIPNVWAKQQAVDAGAAEAIFIRDGLLTDGASSNVFAVIGGELCTPPLSTYLLAGITRRVVLELANELRLVSRERPIVLDEIYAAQELFLTGTTTDVTPVVQLDGWTIGRGTPGSVTMRLRDALLARLDRRNSRSSSGLS